MSFFGLFRARGRIAGQVSIKDLPDNTGFLVKLAFSRVESAESPIPAYDPDDPFLDADHMITVKELGDSERQPFVFEKKLREGHYHIAMAVWLLRKIRGNPAVQIENFDLIENAAPVVSGMTTFLDRYVYWPDLPDDELHTYGKLDDLIRSD
jgi:hypothetical protein